jgi:hypothetical protein
MIQNGSALIVITDGEKEMSNFHAAYGFVGIISFALGVVFFWIDGMLLWSILFIVLAVMLVMVKIIWNNAIWLDNATRELGDDS